MSIAFTKGGTHVDYVTVQIIETNGSSHKKAKGKRTNRKIIFGFDKKLDLLFSNKEYLTLKTSSFDILNFNIMNFYNSNVIQADHFIKVIQA